MHYVTDYSGSFHPQNIYDCITYTQTSIPNIPAQFSADCLTSRLPYTEVKHNHTHGQPASKVLTHHRICSSIYIVQFSWFSSVTVPYPRAPEISVALFPV